MDTELLNPTVADMFQAAMLASVEDGTMTPVYGELNHHFTPGPDGSGTQLYARELTMPANSCIVSQIHNTAHQYVVSKGRVKVHTQDGKVETLTAPCHGHTLPGTQRVLAVMDETTWTTFHIIPIDLTDPDEIMAWLTRPIHNPLLEDSTP